MASKSTQADAGRFDLFIEQAEYIETDQFREWTIDHPDEELILRKLSQAGAKLITGPRGCGKTTLLLKAFHKMLEEPEQGTFPVYVNFKASLKLEPFYNTTANAAFLFQQWLIYKIYDGVYATLEELGAGNKALIPMTREKFKTRIQQLELGKSESLSREDNTVLPSNLEEDINRVLDELGYKRCVLLLDDAAHAFSSEQQRDFFEFFRSVKSKSVSPKAAVYPGVTIYSPTFHVGHDAEQIDVWLKPEAPGYLAFMRRLLKRRLPAEVWAHLLKNEPLLDLVCFAAFGVPRALLNMVQGLYSGGDDDVTPIAVVFTRAAALRAIKRSYDSTMAIFSSLRLKLPMYQKFIDAGRRVFDSCLEAVKQYNKGKPNEHQSVTIAVKKPLSPELAKVFGYFQYAGLLLPRGEVSRGEKGTFELFVLHYAALIDHNAIVVKKAVNVASYIEAFKKRHAKEFTRVTSKTLLGTDDAASVLTLSLPPCQVCKTPRVSESARFCMNCGAPLKTMSVFEALIENDISELPLTTARVKSMKIGSRIKTIKDILLDHEHQELRSVKQIGPYWAKRIYVYAEEYIA